VKGEELTRLQRDVKRLERQREILKKRRTFSREQVKFELIDAAFCRRRTRGSWEWDVRQAAVSP
jgi:hypothetical protein